MRDFFAWLFRGFLHGLFPIRCLGCGNFDQWICENCLAAWPELKRPECPSCRQPSPGWRTCQQCQSHTALTGMFVMSDYHESLVERAITKLKYSCVPQIAEPLGHKLAERCPRWPAANVIVTAVPIHWQRRNERGFNQSELIAQSLAHSLAWSVDFGLLKRSRYTKAQAKLGRHERQHNLSGAITARPGLAFSGKIIILIDDVATTTTTLGECATALRHAGATEVWGVVLARSKIS